MRLTARRPRLRSHARVGFWHPHEIVEINLGGGTEAVWDGKSSTPSDTTPSMKRCAQDPVPAGGWGYAAGNPAAVSEDGDLTRVVTDLQGRVWTRELPLALPHAVDFTENQTGEAIWTPAGGKKFVVTMAEIGRRLGMERHTVAKYMDSGPPQAQTRNRRSCLEPFHAYLEQRLSQGCTRSRRSPSRDPGHGL